MHVVIIGAYGSAGVAVANGLAEADIDLTLIDDGEPGGSAGKPALTILEREEIENVAAVVTRYYGGTNLGVGGLAVATFPGRPRARQPQTRVAFDQEVDDGPLADPTGPGDDDDQ